MLLLLALGLPLVDMHVVTRFSTSTVFTGPSMLSDAGMPELALAVLVTLVVMPAAKLATLLIVLFGVKANRPPAWLPWLFGWLERISPWAMVEVFLLGAFVAYTRLRALSNVDVGPAIIAMGGVMLLMVATDATLDSEAIWQEIEAKMTPLKGRIARGRPIRDAPTTAHGRAMACRQCGRVTWAEDGESCERCHHKLFFRKQGGLSRVWALMVAATLLYVPANILPVMSVTRLGKGGPKTILGGVVELAQDHLWGLAALVLFASVIVPIVKVISLAVMLVMTHRKSPSRLFGRTGLFRFVQAIGRWSMIDIFMLAILVGVVRFGFIATVTPGMGAVAFCAVVIVTMFATEAFDPRWMWDAANSNGQEGPRETGQS